MKVGGNLPPGHDALPFSIALTYKDMTLVSLPCLPFHRVIDGSCAVFKTQGVQLSHTRSSLKVEQRWMRPRCTVRRRWSLAKCQPGFIGCSHVQSKKRSLFCGWLPWVKFRPTGSDTRAPSSAQLGNERSLVRLTSRCRNTGERDTGERDTGERDTGERDTGERGTGQRDTGERDTGERDTGERDTGERDTGERVMVRDTGERVMVRDTGERVMVRDMGERVMVRDMGERVMVRDTGERVMVRDTGERVMVRDTGERVMVRDTGERVMVRDMGERVMVRDTGEMVLGERVMVRDTGEMVLGERDTGEPNILMHFFYQNHKKYGDQFPPYSK